MLRFSDPQRPIVADLLRALSQGPTAFADDVGGWVLVGHIPDSASGVTRTSVRAVRAPTGDVEAMLDEQCAALVIKKREGSDPSDTIFVGRSSSNDVCISHGSVSKVQARMRRAGDGLFVQDAGSSNGTLVNGDAVGGVDVAIVHGDLIRFGSVLLQCFEPQRLHSVLERFVRTRR